MGPVQSRLATRIADGVLVRDLQQIEAAKALDSRLVALAEYEPGSGGLLGRFFGGRETVPRGLYMYGGVGRGKSMLMDWFFESAEFGPKRRTHFHAFMLDVHARINAWRKLDKSGRRAHPHHVRGAGDDPIPPVARALASEGKLLCTAAPVYHVPLGQDTDAAMSAAWDRLTRGGSPVLTELVVQGRRLQFPTTARGVLRSDFTSLCESNRSPAEYLEIAQAFHTVILENVPQMGAHMRNAAKRFVTLIDALYETRTKLVMSSAVEPAELYEKGDGVFEFERTVSRLMEMRTEEYLALERGQSERD